MVPHFLFFLVVERVPAIVAGVVAAISGGRTGDAAGVDWLRHVETQEERGGLCAWIEVWEIETWCGMSLMELNGRQLRFLW